MQSQTPDHCIMTVQCPKQFHSFFFFRDQVFAPQIKTMEEICWVTPTPLKASFKSPIPYAKSNTQSAHKDNPESKIVLSSLFWGTKSLHHRLRLRKRFLGVTPTPLRVSFKSPISCTKSSTRSVHKDSPVSETVLFLFSRDQVFASQIKTKEGICWVTPTPLWASLSLLGKVKHLISTWRQPNVGNSFFFLHCLGTKSLYHRSRLRKRLFGQHITKEEIVWATLLLCVSFSPSLLYCLIPESA